MQWRCSGSIRWRLMLWCTLHAVPLEMPWSMPVCCSVVHYSYHVHSHYIELFVAVEGWWTTTIWAFVTPLSCAVTGVSVQCACRAVHCSSLSVTDDWKAIVVPLLHSPLSCLFSQASLFTVMTLFLLLSCFLEDAFTTCHLLMLEAWCHHLSTLWKSDTVTLSSCSTVGWNVQAAFDPTVAFLFFIAIWLEDIYYLCQALEEALGHHCSAFFMFSLVLLVDGDDLLWRHGGDIPLGYYSSFSTVHCDDSHAYCICCSAIVPILFFSRWLCRALEAHSLLGWSLPLLFCSAVTFWRPFLFRYLSFSYVHFSPSACAFVPCCAFSILTGVLELCLLCFSVEIVLEEVMWRNIEAMSQAVCDSHLSIQ